MSTAPELLLANDRRQVRELEAEVELLVEERNLDICLLLVE